METVLAYLNTTSCHTEPCSEILAHRSRWFGVAGEYVLQDGELSSGCPFPVLDLVRLVRIECAWVFYVRWWSVVSQHVVPGVVRGLLLFLLYSVGRVRQEDVCVYRGRAHVVVMMLLFPVVHGLWWWWVGACLQLAALIARVKIRVKSEMAKGTGRWNLKN